jgi:hypothetical protein
MSKSFFTTWFAEPLAIESLNSRLLRRFLNSTAWPVLERDSDIDDPVELVLPALHKHGTTRVTWSSQEVRVCIDTRMFLTYQRKASIDEEDFPYIVIHVYMLKKCEFWLLDV